MVNIKKNIRKMKKQLKRGFLTLPVIRCYDSVSVRIGYDKTTNTSKIDITILSDGRRSKVHFCKSYLERLIAIRNSKQG